MLLPLLSALALAADPARCVATYTASPTAECGLRGEVKASAAGPSEKAAEKATRKQLDKVVDLTVAAQRARIPAMGEDAFAGCRAKVRDDAYVNCFADATLADEALCFVELADADCWTGQVRQVEGTGWQVANTARDAFCKEVDARLVALNYTDLATRRAVCAASCAAKATVKCVGG